VRARLVLSNTLQGFRCARGTLLLAFAILTLALTASTVTFSIVDAVAFRPLPYASPDDLVGVMSSGSRPGAWAISSAFESLVFGVTPTDPATYTLVAVFILLVGSAAAFVPALRAARLDPVETLRRE
jgi:ABC-type antimicrobial peptide transport system permease subunit